MSKRNTWSGLNYKNLHPMDIDGVLEFDDDSGSPENQTILSILDFIKLLFIKSDEHLRKNEHNIINEKINLDERF